MSEPDRPGQPDEPSRGPTVEGPAGGSEEVEVPHRDDGLDLARTIARATAGSTGATPRRSSRPARDPRLAPGPGVSRRGRVSGAHPDDRDPQLLSGEISRLVDDRGWELSLRMRGVFSRWSEVVGEEIAAHCTPESFIDGRLVARTDSTAWATQLGLLAPSVCRRLNEELGPGTVMVIDVVGPHLPTWKKGARSVRDGRGPRDTYG